LQKKGLHFGKSNVGWGCDVKPAYNGTLYNIYVYKFPLLVFFTIIKSLVEVAGVEPASLLPCSRISTRLFYFGVSKGYEIDQPTLSICFKVIQSLKQKTTLVPRLMTPTPN